MTRLFGASRFRWLKRNKTSIININAIYLKMNLNVIGIKIMEI